MTEGTLRRALVTGGAGFIGSHLVDRLLDEGWTVTAVDNLATGSIANLGAALPNPAFTFVELDVTSEAFSAAVSESAPEVVFHLAAQMDVRVSVAKPMYDATVNVLGTINVLQASAAADVRKVVFTSSGGCIYGPPDAEPIDEDFPTHPHSPYGVSKLSAELYLDMYRILCGLDYTTLALGNVYGPRQDPHGEAGVVAIFGTAMLTGSPTKIFGDGSASRDYVHVADVVNALLLAASRGQARRYNIGSGTPTSVLSLHDVMARIVGCDLVPHTAPPRAAELQAITLDSARAKAELDWAPQWHFEAGLSDTIDWLRATLEPAASDSST